MIPLTAWQREEVLGLLDVVGDDLANGEERIVWGRVQDGGLVVLDPDEAVEELTYRADYFLAEAPGHGKSGVAAARSLLALARKVAGGPLPGEQVSRHL